MPSERHSAPVPTDPVLRAMHDCVMDVGLRRTTLADVARRAGVSRMTVYRQFDDLSGILSALLTALAAGLALVPLLFGAGEPGREILHPVAVTIFGGLVSATVLDAVLTPVLFLMFGRKPLERIQASRAGQPSGGLTPAEAF